MKKIRIKMKIVNRFWRLIGVWFGIGKIPYAPGTLGTLGSIPLVVCLDFWDAYSALGISIRVVVLILLGVGAIYTESLSGEEDPSFVVSDEVGGFLVTTFGIALTFKGLIVGFVLFRFFDILKPYPIRKVERLRGGIILDDLMAGLYANIILRLFLKAVG